MTLKRLTRGACSFGVSAAACTLTQTHLGLHGLGGEQRHEAARVARADERAVLRARAAELGLRHELAVVYALAQRLRAAACTCACPQAPNQAPGMRPAACLTPPSDRPCTCLHAIVALPLPVCCGIVACRIPSCGTKPLKYSTQHSPPQLRGQQGRMTGLGTAGVQLAPPPAARARRRARRSRSCCRRPAARCPAGCGPGTAPGSAR